MHCPYSCCIHPCPFMEPSHGIPQSMEPLRAPTQSNSVTVTTIEKRFEKPYIKADLRIPEFHGIPDKNVEKYINNAVMSDITEFSDQLTAAAREYADKAAQNNEKFIPYVISTIYELSYNKNNIISFLVIYYELVQGLNNFIKVSYNYDIFTGKSLMLKDLFVPGADYQQLINTEIRKELIKNKQNYFPGTAENFKGIAEDQPFYLREGYLSIFFGFNQIAPTAAQIPLFEIPFYSFGNEVKTIFR
jgi:hypothetical protein